MRFVGEFDYKVDGQRRVPLPKEWREVPAPTFYLVPGVNNDIRVITEETFEEEWVEKSKKIDHKDSKGHAELMRFARKATIATVDGQNRIKLTPKLMEHANIDSEVVMIGGVIQFYLLSPENAALIRDEDD